MYVVCFYWQGDRWQHPGFSYKDKNYVNRQQPFLNKVGKVKRNIPSRYVNNLYQGVLRFASRPFTFICFTNENLEVHPDIEIRRFNPVTQMGVLPRVFVFSREAGLFGHQVLCLDLDVVIVGSLEDIMNYDGLFCARSKFKHGEEHKLDGDIFSFRAGPETEKIFWKPFIKNVKAVERQTEGRERYWFRHVAEAIADRWDEYAPGQIISYKRHVRKARGRRPDRRAVVPEKARIVSCHGTPRPDQIGDRWIREFWQ